MAVGSEVQSNIQDSIIDAVMSHVRDAAPTGLLSELTLDTDLDEAGLDSLARMDVVNRIERGFQLRFAEDSLYDIASIRDLVNLIESKITPQSLNQPIAPKLADKGIALGSEFGASLPEVIQFEQRRMDMTAAGVELPFFRVNEQVQGACATIEGNEVISFTSFDYLGMARDARVARAASDAIVRFGTSASASRLVGGNTTLLESLDKELAAFLGAEAAAVFPSGYGTNASLFGHLFGENDLILYDELAHNSIVQGATLSLAKRRPFPHNDAAFVDTLLADVRDKYRRVVIAIEGVYSMDGDFPNLNHFLEVKKRHEAMLYVDEAHSLGVLGATGRGICEHFGVSANEGDLWMGTISKAMGSSGGYVAGRRALIDYLRYTTPAMVFSTALAPSSAAAALEAIRVLRDEPERVSRVREHARLFLKLAKDSGLSTGSSHETPIIPIILGDSRLCLWASQELLKRGINAQPILYPAVPESASRLRFFITADHSEEQICSAVECVSELIRAAKAPSAI